ncbi:CHAT domain-containing protein [Oscillatoria acuminata]|uniref:Filamentous hemagglutinin family N-terminal domain protein n=1 Tax=Oscillatoria acuminata PCC 6304 TaxID=56110 RepID=K9TFC9_9CYAN|nr:CHAT domain-containing protein [Oscillatoria acuminata]AFY81582.1 filamentous hemagglutinin family N-terminal domain protein [Oscillatoria acuminata PCC 6304]
MISPIKSIYIGWLFTLSLCGTLTIQPTHAQPIVPGTDTKTQVTPNGNTFNIEGGTVSEDGSNLFHTFTEFGLSAGEIANFMSNSQIQNILTRINGGNPSIINGLIQVTGGQSNLFLMNPSGILFGSGASLNVPGSFMATTADRIGLSGSGSVQWFDAKHTNLYSSLVGSPSQFVFSMPEAGAIVNAGNLGVGPNQNLILLGGSVVSTGTLSAQGSLIVAGVPGQSLVRISQVGHLLSFDVDPYLLQTTPTEQSASPEVRFNPQSLPELLAGGGGSHATGVQINSDGTVTLTGSGLSVEHGDVSNRAIQAQTAIVFATGNLTVAESQLETTGNLHLQADNEVRFVDSPMNPVEVKVGRNLQIRGDTSVTLDLLNHPDSQIQVQGNLMVVSEGNITLDGALQSGGNLRIVNTASQPIAFQSQNELALMAGGDVVFGNYTGGPLRVDAVGSIQGGNISLSIAEEGNPSPGGVHLSAGGRGTSPSSVTDSLELSSGSIVVGDIAIARPDSSVTVQAMGSIQTGAIATEGGNITLSSAWGGIDTTGGNLDASASSNPQGGAIALTAENRIISGDLITENNGIQIKGPLELSDVVTFRTIGSTEDAGGGNIQVTGTINGNVQLNLEAGIGDVVLEGEIGNQVAIAELSIDAQNIDFRSTTTSQGPIAIDATGTVTLGDRLTTTGGTVNITASDAIVTDDITTSGASIHLNSQNSQITTGNLESGAIAADGGTISLRSFAGLSTGAIDTHSTIGAGGNVTLHSEQNDIQASFINTEGATIGGNVSIQTTGAVRIVNSFLSQTGGEFSISTAAPQGGEITITHGRSEFVIGDLDGNGILENGAIAAITTGSGEFLSLGESVSQSRIYLNPNPSLESATSETASESRTTLDEKATNQEETQSSDPSTPSESDSQPEAETPEETDSTTEDSSTDLGEETPPVEETTAVDPDPTPEAPGVESATPEEPVAVSEPAVTPTPEEPVAVSEPAVTPTPEEPVAVSEPAVTPTPEKPVAVSEPAVTPTPEEPVAVSEPAVTPTPEEPVAVSEPAVTPTPEEPVAVSEPQGTDIPRNIPISENQGTVETIPRLEQVIPPPVVEILPSEPVELPIIREVLTEPIAVMPTEILQNPEPLTQTPGPTVEPVAVNSELPAPPPPAIVPPLRTPQSSPMVPPPALPRNDISENARGVVEMEVGNLGSREVPILQIERSPSSIAPSSVEGRVPTAPIEQVEGTVAIPAVEAIASPGKLDSPQLSVQLELEAAAQASIPQIEQMRMQEFYPNQQGPLSEDEAGAKNVRDLLQGIRQEINVNPAVVYAMSLPEELQLVVMTAEGVPIIHTIPTVSRDALRAKVTELLSELTNPRKTNTDSYMSASVQLYQWLIAPIAAELEAQGIDMLMFSLDAGLRGIPLAALHDGEQFLIEKYRLGLIPSVNLTETSYKNLNETRVLAMGASDFKDPSVPSLKAVPVELALISEVFSLEKYFLNEEFTADNLRASRRQQNYDIIHLATHVKFYNEIEYPEGVSVASRRKSYIQFWDEQVPLEQMRQLGLDAGTVELLVLSACETAVGSSEIELGFAGLAVQMGVKSVLASLWQVDDEGTLGLMSEFYQQLSAQEQTIKSEALRQAQLAFLRGEVWMSGDHLVTPRGEIDLPPQITPEMGDRSFAHPYYWAAFTLVGSPW